jgi:hypothetical protein
LVRNLKKKGNNMQKLYKATLVAYFVKCDCGCHSDEKHSSEEALKKELNNGMSLVSTKEVKSLKDLDDKLDKEAIPWFLKDYCTIETFLKKGK